MWGLFKKAKERIKKKETESYEESQSFVDMTFFTTMDAVADTTNCDCDCGCDSSVDSSCDCGCDCGCGGSE